MLVGLQELVCNKSAFEEAADRVGIRFHNTSLIIDPVCGKPASQWFDSLATSLQQAGIDPSAIVEITAAVSMVTPPGYSFSIQTDAVSPNTRPTLWEKLFGCCSV